MFGLLIMPKSEGCYRTASFTQILNQKGACSVGLILSTPLASAGCDHWNTMAFSLQVCTSNEMLTNGKCSRKTHKINKNSGDHVIQRQMSGA